MLPLFYAYWPAIYLLAGLGFGSYWARIRHVPGGGWRKLLYVGGSLGLLYVGGSLYAAYAYRQGGAIPFANPAIGLLSRTSILSALSLGGLSCWLASRLPIRYGCWLVLGALYSLLNVLHVVLPSQGSLCEVVGLFTARRLPDAPWGAVATSANHSSSRPYAHVLSNGWLTLTMVHGRDTVRLFDGVGPWLKLRWQAPPLTQAP